MLQWALALIFWALAQGDDVRVFLTTYVNDREMSMGYLLASATYHKLTPSILGYGDKAWWPDGLGKKINAVREFVLRSAHLRPNDLLLFADGFDVIVQSNESEIRDTFQRLETSWNRSIIFTGDRNCFPRLKDVCTDPPISDLEKWNHPRAFLNSGAFIGRVALLKSVLLPDPVPDVMASGDQAYFQRKLAQHPEAIAVDVHCELLCTVARDLEHEGLVQLADGRVVVPSVGGKGVTKPSVLHFPGGGHWPIWRKGMPASVMQEVFKQGFPEQFGRLFDHVGATVELRGAHQAKLRLSLATPLMSLVRARMCLTCQVSPNGQCRMYEVDVVSWDSEVCSELRLAVPLAILLSGLLCWFRHRGRWLRYCERNPKSFQHQV